MASQNPRAPERSTALTITRIAIILTVLAVLFLIGALIFRGCHDDDAGIDTLDPDTPLPGTEETGEPVVWTDANRAPQRWLLPAGAV